MIIINNDNNNFYFTLFFTEVHIMKDENIDVNKIYS